MSVTKRIIQKHLAELVTFNDLECEGFDAHAFAAEMDELLENLGYVDTEEVGKKKVVNSEEVPWSL